ncbi:MAG: efflux RND transporter periplasmic adaptor subunit [Gemmatimonadota bacterium]
MRIEEGVGRRAARSWRLAAGACLVLVLSLALPGCSQSGGTEEASSPAQSGMSPGSTAPTAVPVRVDTVAMENLDVVVTAPGRTEALRQDRVRAPFPARLVSLRVTDGDRVKAGEVVAEVESKNSEAALRGARQMLASARTAQDSADAHRAVELAQRGLVRQALRAPTAGVVLSHAAETGDYVDEGEVLVTIAEAGAVYFDAQVSQSDVARIRPGQHATIDMPAAGGPVTAVVHGVLPSASSENLSAPVRLDFQPAHPGLSVGLFGTAHIVVAQRKDAIVVPAASVLRDDVTGVSRIAEIRPDGTAHWVVVQTGVQQGTRVEILSPRLAPGTRVVTDGQVGLPEGAKVQVERAAPAGQGSEASGAGVS